MKSRYLAAAALSALTIAPAAAHAQAQQGTPAPPATTVPPEASAVPPPIVALPAQTPTPAPVPVPTAAVPVVPTVRVPPAATAPRPSSPTATPTPRVTPTPLPTPTPTPGVPLTAAPEPAATATPPLSTATPELMPATPVENTAAPPFSPAVDEAEQGGLPGWLLPLVGAIVVAGVLLFLLARLRREGEEEDAVVDDVVEPLAEPIETAPVVPPVAPLPAAPRPSRPAPDRAWLTVDIRPIRAGVNLLTATLEAEVVIRNEGAAPAEDVRVDLRLLSARGGEDTELAGFFAKSVARSAVPPFTLPPGESRTVTRLVTLPRGAINVLSAGNRPMFVPVAAVNLRYVTTAGVRAQTAAAVAVGIERPGADKLAPFWLDTAARMHTDIAARPHAAAIRT